MRASFIHSGGPTVASYRLRGEVLCDEVGATMNDLSADALVFSKPEIPEIELVRDAIREGKPVIVDICDNHFDVLPHYQWMVEVADVVTCPTYAMAEIICKRLSLAVNDGRVQVIPDAYEYPEAEPHCNGVKLLWFGHRSNLNGLLRVIRELDDYPLMIVTNDPMGMPWSRDEMLRQFAAADIVVLPATAEYKSPNRAVEAARQGCYVVAEPHPAFQGLSFIWRGNLKEGIEWTRQNPSLARTRTQWTQEYVRTKYSPRILAAAWKMRFEQARSRSTSAQANADGRAGPRWTWPVRI